MDLPQIDGQADLSTIKFDDRDVLLNGLTVIQSVGLANCVVFGCEDGVLIINQLQELTLVPLYIAFSLGTISSIACFIQDNNIFIFVIASEGLLNIFRVAAPFPHSEESNNCQQITPISCLQVPVNINSMNVNILPNNKLPYQPIPASNDYTITFTLLFGSRNRILHFYELNILISASSSSCKLKSQRELISLPSQVCSLTRCSTSPSSLMITDAIFIGMERGAISILLDRYIRSSSYSKRPSNLFIDKPVTTLPESDHVRSYYTLSACCINSLFFEFPSNKCSSSTPSSLNGTFISSGETFELRNFVDSIPSHDKALGFSVCVSTLGFLQLFRVTSLPDQENNCASLELYFSTYLSLPCLVLGCHLFPQRPGRSSMQLLLVLEFGVCSLELSIDGSSEKKSDNESGQVLNMRSIIRVFKKKEDEEVVHIRTYSHLLLPNQEEYVLVLSSLKDGQLFLYSSRI